MSKTVDRAPILIEKMDILLGSVISLFIENSLITLISWYNTGVLIQIGDARLRQKVCAGHIKSEWLLCNINQIRSVNSLSNRVANAVNSFTAGVKAVFSPALNMAVA